MLKKLVFLALLPVMAVFAGNIKVIDEQSFNDEVGSGLVLVDFYATWCGPCKRLGPVLERVADDMEGQVDIYKVNIDHSGKLADKYEVQGVPTIILFKNGKEVGRQVGFYDKSAVKKFIDSKR